MPQPISNIATPQQGLISTNPFLGGPAPSTGGSTSIQAAFPTLSPSVPNPSGGVFPSTPTGATTTSTNIPLTGLISPQNKTGTPSSTPLSTSGGATGGVNSYGLTSSSPNWYQLQQGESTQNYLARTQGGSAPAGTTSPSSPPQNNGVTLQNGLISTPNNNAATGGAIVANAPSGGTGIPPPNLNQGTGPNTATGNTFANTVGTLANTAATSTPEYQAALAQYNTANANLQKLRDQYSTENADIATTPGDLSLATGEQGALYNRFSGQETALTGEMSAAQQAAQVATGQQSTEQSGLGTAAGLISPTQVPYSNQYLSPVTGQPVGGGGSTGSLPASAQDFVNNLAQQVQNGQMTRQTAEGELSAYGPAGLQALNTALGPNFNTNASTASAGTTASGQQLQTQAASANQALTTLQNLYQALAPFSTTGIPGVNSVSNSIESFLGSSQLSGYQAALTDARQQLEGVLAAAGGGTPTGYESAAQSYLPDNMTPSQLAQNIATVQALIQQKVSSFTSSGSQSNGNTTSGSQPSGWF